MKKRNYPLIYTCIVLITVILFSVLSIYAAATFKDAKTDTLHNDISAKAAALYEPTGKTFVYSKNGDETLPMASTTKIMTAIVVAESCNIYDTVIIGPESIGIEGSSAYLREGDEYTILELLYALMLQSANDAATALAYYVAGGIVEFANMMNDEARKLGLSNTHFANPHGLDDENHYTSAKDLAIMSAKLMEIDVLRKIVSTYKKTFTYGDRSRTYVNHNKLLSLYDGSVGVKTGYTKRSGRCLVGAAEKYGMTFISVTLDAPSDWSDHGKLLDFAFDTFEKIQVVEKGDYISDIKVISGNKDSLSISAEDDLYIIKEKDGEGILEYIYLPNYLIAPIKEGEVVGKAIYKVENKAYSINLVTTEEIKLARKDNIFTRLLKKISK